jgi:hypothetical protein
VEVCLKEEDVHLDLKLKRAIEAIQHGVSCLPLFVFQGSMVSIET